MVDDLVYQVHGHQVIRNYMVQSYNKSSVFKGLIIFVLFVHFLGHEKSSCIVQEWSVCMILLKRI